MRSMQLRTASSSVKRASARTSFPRRSTKIVCASTTMISRDGPVGEERSSGLRPSASSAISRKLLLVGAGGSSGATWATMRLSASHLRAHHVVRHLRPVEDGEVHVVEQQAVDAPAQLDGHASCPRCPSRAAAAAP